MAIDLGSIGASITLDASNFIGNAKSAGDAMQGLQKQSEGLSKRGGLTDWINNNSQSLNTLGTGFTVFGALVTGAMGIAGKTTMDFEAQMSSLGAVSGATAEQMERAEEVALDIGYQTTMSATEAAAALEILVKAGVSLDDALNGVALAAVNLAEATGVDIVTASETAAAAMNIFGYEADEANRVMDAISQSANASSLDVNDWSLALKYAGPIVAALGWDIEDLAEMMVILGDAGIRGEVGSTAIRNILLSLSNPTADVTAAFAKYNVELFDANGNLRDMSSITADLAPAWDKMTQAEKLHFAELIAGKQGVTSFTALMEDQTEAVLDGGNAFDRAAKRMEDAGTTSEMAKRRMDNLAGSVEELKGTVETLMISFMSGLTPIIRRATDALSSILQIFLRLPGPVQTAIAGIVGVTGVLALMTGGGILAAVKIAELADAFKQLTNSPTIISGLTKSFGFLANPITLAVVAVAALVAGFVLLYTKSEAFRNMVHALGRAIDTLTGGAISAAIAKVKELYEIFQLVFGSGDLTKNVSVTTSFDGGAHYIEAVTLPDGTKEWIIKEKDGSEFGKVISSYTDPEDPNYAYITIQPTDGGEPFQTRVNLLTNDLDTVEIEVTADTSKAAESLSELEIKANRWRAAMMGINGLLQMAALAVTRAFEAVNNVLIVFNDQIEKVGSAINTVAKEFSDFVGPLGDVDTHFGILKDLITGDWGKIDWRDILDVLGLGDIIPVIEGAIRVVKEFQSLMGGDAEPGSTGTAGVHRTEKTASGSAIQPNYRHDETGGTMAGNYADASDPYRPNEGGYSSLKKMQAAMMEMYSAGGLANQSVSTLFDSIGAGQQPMQQSTIDMNLMASTAPVMGLSMETTSTQVKGAGTR